MDIAFIGWFLIFGGLVAGLTRLSYEVLPTPNKTEQIWGNIPPLKRLEGDRGDAWIDKAIARQAQALVQVMPPPPIARKPMDTSDTPSDTGHDTTPDTGRDTPHDTAFSESDFEAVWGLLDQGVRSRSEIIRSVWGDIPKTGRPGSRWMGCSEFIAQVIREYERYQVENLERVYEES